LRLYRDMNAKGAGHCTHGSNKCSPP
jgi:hypothetical protein